MKTANEIKPYRDQLAELKAEKIYLMVKGNKDTRDSALISMLQIWAAFTERN